MMFYDSALSKISPRLARFVLQIYTYEFKIFNRICRDRTKLSNKSHEVRSKELLM